MGEMRKKHKMLAGRPGGKRPLEWPRHRLEDNIKMDLMKTEQEGVDWIQLTQDRDH
jgi:hypothetical protein